MFYKKEKVVFTFVLATLLMGCNPDIGWENCVATDLKNDLIMSEFEVQKIDYIVPKKGDRKFKQLFHPNSDPRHTWICVKEDDKDKADKIRSELRTIPCSEKCCRKSWRSVGQVKDEVFLSDRNPEVINILTSAGITFDVIDGHCGEIKGVELCRQDIQWREQDDAYVKSILDENHLWLWQEICPDGN
ncbi:hypothetical protein [Methylophaga sp.]|uniref:hypothetical protein n=1 Tax=Methylophaga sp. TaxID=2024840 RepID=UPI002715F419|nr:hypothetical protein [Methylophaga sp.]MDO8825950.1 hypothetical protein [Methylophaga sp.]